MPIHPLAPVASQPTQTPFAKESRNPTVWSDHPLISRTDACKRLAEAPRDDTVQELAWTQHGFRSGLVGVGNDPSVLTVVGIPESIDAVVPMPSAAVMERILEALRVG